MITPFILRRRLSPRLLAFFYGPEHIKEMKALARRKGGTLEQIASVALAERILEHFHVTPLTEAN